MSTGRTASILRRLEGKCEKELGAVAKLIVGFVKSMCPSVPHGQLLSFEVAMFMLYIEVHRCNVRVSVSTYAS